MTDVSQKKNKELKISSDAEFTPRAVKLSGRWITGAVFSVTTDGKEYYTLASGPDFEPTGWADDSSVLDIVVTKHGFTELSQNSDIPQLKAASLSDDFQKLSKWIEKNR